MTEAEKQYIEHNKQFFMDFWERIADRPGAAECLKWLETETDFFTAPASSRFHGSKPGGLLIHSVNVCDELLNLLDHHATPEVDRRSAIIVALLHDVCKCNTYRPTTKRQRDKQGNWGDVQGYEINDTLPMGHGEKSLYLVQKSGLRLSDAEAAAIRWHMGAYNDKDKLSTLGAAFDRWPLALFLHMADMIAAHYVELEA